MEACIQPFPSLGRVDACGCVRRASIGLAQEPPFRPLVASTRLLMRQRSEPLHSFLSRCLHLYVMLATIYTLGNLCISVLRYHSPSRNSLLRLSSPRIALPSNMSVQQAEEFLWSNFTLSSHHSLAWDPILSRAFSRLMHPSRTIPYYYRATGNFDNDDITVTTLISSDRFPVFRNLVRRYKGVLSPAICTANPPSTST